ncbi:hypothetical protein AFL01nite_18620 [Aeromicrobium flavum]|uniref:Uncharacterized protein n=1 Tax=Aeromicrobium flavum TaxID=416568 RepID=A0A512HVT6_9ACTN|nr:hypothetical protein AFL01nite_18620 [Aeromicrobium flavum]
MLGGLSKFRPVHAWLLRRALNIQLRCACRPGRSESDCDLDSRETAHAERREFSAQDEVGELEIARPFVGLLCAREERAARSFPEHHQLIARSGRSDVEERTFSL